MGENSSDVANEELENDELDDEDGELGDLQLDPEEIDRRLAAMTYDDTGNIYVDGAGRLRDKQDANFKVAKVKDSHDEMIRLTLYSIVNDCLKADSELPFARETYDRLRSEGAGDLEARTLMTTVWTDQLHQIFSTGAPDGASLMEGLGKLTVKR